MPGSRALTDPFQLSFQDLLALGFLFFFLLESFFSIPGLGYLITNAIANTDRPVLIAVTVLGTLAFVVFNIISDVLYALVDPRVQLR